MKIWDCKRSLNLANLSPPLACEQTGKFLTVWVLIFWRKETQKTHYWIIVLHHTKKKGHFAFPSNDVIVMHRAASLLVLLGTVCQQALWFILVDRSAISFSRSTHLCHLLTSAGWESQPFRAVQQIQPLLLQGSQRTASNNPWSLLFQLHFCQFRETLTCRLVRRVTVMTRAQNWKKKLSIYQLVYVPTLTYGHKLWVKNKQMRLRIQAVLRGVVGLSCGHLEGARSRATALSCRREPTEVIQASNQNSGQIHYKEFKKHSNINL